MVNREHNTIRPNRRDGIHQIRSGEMPGRGQPDILLEIVPNRFLHREPFMPIMPHHPMIHAPEMSGHHFPEMPNDHLDAGEAIEDTMDAEPEHVALKVLCELQRRDA